MKQFEQTIQVSVRILGFLLVLFLFLQSLFTICITLWQWEWFERNFYIQNSVFPQLFAILLFITLCYFLEKECAKRFFNKRGKLLIYGAMFVVALFLLYWYHQTKFAPLYDEENVFTCAQNLLQGNYSDWLPGGYPYMYSHQNGLILFVALLLKLFGYANAISVFYLLNIFFYLLTLIYAYRSISIMFSNNHHPMQAIMMILFLPYAFFTMLIYGNIIGFGWAMGGVFYILQYLQQKKKHQLLLSVIFLIFAVIFKQNCLIIFVGCLLLLLFDCIRNRTFRFMNIAAAVLYVLIFLIGIQIPKMSIQAMSGLELGKGNTPLAWIAMGIQYNKGTTPGVYNTYVDQVFRENHYDHDETAQAALSSINDSIKEFQETPHLASFYFGSKLAAEWANPTFECFAFQYIHTSLTQQSAMIKSSIQPGGKLNFIFTIIFDSMQIIILFGTLTFLSSAKDASLHQLFFIILFIGGFIFFTFWEAKARYVLPFFFLLIPYAYLGYQQCIYGGRELKDRIKNKTPHLLCSAYTPVYITIGMVVILIIAVAMLNTTFVNHFFKVDYDTGQYYEYIKSLVKDSWLIPY